MLDNCKLNTDEVSLNLIKSTEYINNFKKIICTEKISHKSFYLVLVQ